MRHTKIIGVILLIFFISGCIGQFAEKPDRKGESIVLGANTAKNVQAGDTISISVRVPETVSRLMSWRESGYSVIMQNTSTIRKIRINNDFSISPTFNPGLIRPRPENATFHSVLWSNLSKGEEITLSLSIPPFPDDDRYRYHLAAVSSHGLTNTSTITLTVNRTSKSQYRNEPCDLPGVHAVHPTDSDVLHVIRRIPTGQKMVAAVTANCSTRWSFETNVSHIVDISPTLNGLYLLGGDSANNSIRLLRYPEGQEIMRWNESKIGGPQFRSLHTIEREDLFLGGSLNSSPYAVRDQLGADLFTQYGRMDGFSINDISEVNGGYLLCLEPLDTSSQYSNLGFVEKPIGGFRWNNSVQVSHCSISQTAELPNATATVIETDGLPYLIAFNGTAGIEWIRTIRRETNTYSGLSLVKNVSSRASSNGGLLSALTRVDDHLYLGGQRNGNQWLVRTDLQGHPDRSSQFKQGQIVHLAELPDREGVRFLAINTTGDGPFRLSTGTWLPPQ